jgi:uncharacterized protein YndB with AHSA1/START domain
MTESLNLSTIIPVPPQRVFHAWLDSKEHGGFTGGGEAIIDPHPGGSFTAWDGYINGKTLEIEPSKRILQSWRTTEFSENDPDSQLELLFKPVQEGTQLTLIHTNIPDGQAESYKQGWLDYYFKPMQEYFSK